MTRRHVSGGKRATFRRLARDPSAVDRRSLIDAFHRLYYESHDSTWARTYWRGVPVLKCPLDLWVYQEILTETRPDLIVETGTFGGGSAYYLANVCDLIGKGTIVTIDVDPQQGLPEHDRVTYVTGSSVDEEIVADLRRRAEGTQSVMVILDSDHRRDHVLRELELYSPLVTRGCYLIVEDTNINGHPVAPRFGPGPLEALTDFLAGNDDFEVDASREKLLLTFNPSGYLRRR